jgi:TDG/mug DNA glycosylase family protein
MPDIKQAFPPILGETPRLLILGSMPGEASLRLGQYYGHGRNAFWPILCELLGVPAEADYSTRTRALIERGIALWDVIAACERDGSLDTAIRPASIQVNDFATLLEAQPSIGRIAFNGGKAEREYRRRVLPSLPDRQRQLPLARLPSTSPAHAGMRFEAKLAAWRVLLNWLAD